MPSYTRRTHIVRCYPDNDAPGNTYIDVEVLDAIAFRNENNDEMILDMKASQAAPYIVDDTGGDHKKTPDKGTRRSHMKRLKGDNGAMLDVEVIDCIALDDENGGAWILDMSGTADDPGIFDTTDGGGDNKATRRTHTEIVTSPFGGKKSDGSYLSVVRCDNIAFRTILGRETVISCPSFDDGKGKRAETFTTPEGYDPSNEDGPKPPTNSDGGVYVAFVKNDDGTYAVPTIGDTKIQQGPLWWIRKVSVGGDILELDWEVTITPKGSTGLITPRLSGFADPANILTTLDTLQTPSGNGGPDIVQKVTDKMLGYYSIWNNIRPNVNYDINHPGGPGIADTYILWQVGFPYPYTGPRTFHGVYYPDYNPGYAGSYTSLADAERVMAAINSDYPGRIIGYVHNPAAGGQPASDTPIYSGGSIPVYLITIPGVPSGAIVENKIRGSVIFNLGKLKSASTDPKDKGTLTLTFNIPATPAPYEFNFRTYKNKHRDFSTDSKGVPTWNMDDEQDIFVILGGQQIEGGTGNKVVTVTLKIDLKTLKITGSQPSAGYVKPTT